MPNGIKTQVKEVLQSNGWINNIEIAQQIHKPIQEVDKVLKEFEKKGFIDVRPAK